jgi:hypothetical protein
MDECSANLRSFFFLFYFVSIRECVCLIDFVASSLFKASAVVIQAVPTINEYSVGRIT